MRNGFANRLSDIVQELKDNEEFRSDYLDMNLHDKDLIRWAKKEGLAEGASQKAVEAAVPLIQKYNANPEDAARDMGAPLEAVLDKLRKEKAFANS